MSEYIIVTSGTDSFALNVIELQERVEAKLKSGYKLVGGVCLGPKGFFYQAMAK